MAKQTDDWTVVRESVRALIRPEVFFALEEFACKAGTKNGLLAYWGLVRSRVLMAVRDRPDATALVFRAKIVAVGTRLALTREQVDSLTANISLELFVDAARRNHSVLLFQSDPAYRDLWQDQSIQQNPPMRVEFEHAVAFGTITDAGSIAQTKSSWGPLVQVRPLAIDDPLHSQHITYQLKPTNKLRMRWEFRDTFKALLKHNRALVTKAMQFTQSTFLTELSPDDHTILRKHLDLSAQQFWQAVRHGERFGPGAIVTFVEELQQKTRGYRFDFEAAASADFSKVP